VVLVVLPSVALSDAHVWRATAAVPTTAFDECLAGHDPVDTLRCVLHPAIRMPVAQLLGVQYLPGGLLLTHNRLAQPLDRLGHRRRTPPQAHTTECEHACNGQVTTRDRHRLSLPRVIAEARLSRRLSSTGRVDRTMV
jgi:hypothetical protein